MNLITVLCSRPQDEEDDEPRHAVTVASTLGEAEAVCRTAYEHEGYTEFHAAETVEGHFGGPVRVLGFTGQGPFSWK